MLENRKFNKSKFIKDLIKGFIFSIIYITLFTCGILMLISDLQLFISLFIKSSIVSILVILSIYFNEFIMYKKGQDSLFYNYITKRKGDNNVGS